MHTILAVDDTPENLDIIRGTLKNEYRIKIAVSGEKAIEMVRKDPPDLILLDVMMPRVDGYMVCKTLKSDPWTRKIPIIFVTALTDPKDEEKGLRLGAVDYITKPINPNIVRARVKTHLELRNTTARVEHLYKETLEGIISFVDKFLTHSQWSDLSNFHKNRTHIFAREFQIKNSWRCKIAAMLSFASVLINNPTLIEKLEDFNSLSSIEQNDILISFSKGSFLIESIPNFADIVSIIEMQSESLSEPDQSTSFTMLNEITQCAQIVRTSCYFTLMQNAGLEYHNCLDKLRAAGHHPELISHLEALVEQKTQTPAEDKNSIIDIESLTTGMVVNEDLLTSDGLKLIAKGGALTDQNIRSIAMLSKTLVIKGSLSGPGKIEVIQD